MESDRVALLYRVSELVRRYGLRPSDAPATFRYVFDDPDKPEHFRLSFEYGIPTDLEKRDKYLQIKAALGCEGDALITDSMSEIEDRVEQAIARAPRARGL